MQMKLRNKLDEQILLELFWSQPAIANYDDGYWCYEVKDEKENILRFGMNVIEESVQVDLKNANFTQVSFSFELVDSIEIINFDSGKFGFTVAPEVSQTKTRIEIELRPYIKINGYTLRRE
ncbi:MAG: hypothetical protein ACRC62_34985 [Microcoleus sp.]